MKVNANNSMSDMVMVPKDKFEELEKKAKEFDKLKEKERIRASRKDPLRMYAHNRFAKEGEDAEKLFKF